MTGAVAGAVTTADATGTTGGRGQRRRERQRRHGQHATGARGTGGGRQIARPLQARLAAGQKSALPRVVGSISTGSIADGLPGLTARPPRGG